MRMRMYVVFEWAYMNKDVAVCFPKYTMIIS